MEVLDTTASRSEEENDGMNNQHLKIQAKKS